MIYHKVNHITVLSVNCANTTGSVAESFSVTAEIYLKRFAPQTPKIQYSCRFQSGVLALSCPKAAWQRRVAVNLTVLVIHQFLLTSWDLLEKNYTYMHLSFIMLISNTECLYLDTRKEQG